MWFRSRYIIQTVRSVIGYGPTKPASSETRTRAALERETKHSHLLNQPDFRGQWVLGAVWIGQCDAPSESSCCTSPQHAEFTS